MAITKEEVIAKMEIVQVWNIQVATDTVIKEDGTEISKSRHRHVLVPFNSVFDTADSSWTTHSHRHKCRRCKCTSNSKCSLDRYSQS